MPASSPNMAADVHLSVLGELRRTLLVLKKVLIVDDSPAQVKLMQGLLEHEGYQPFGLNDPLRVEETITTLHPSLILLDVVMPERNGFQVCRELKGSAQFQSIPVILVTSKDTASDKYWGEQQGADAYVTKPFTREELLRAVRRFARNDPMMNDEFQLAPLPPDADTAEMLEAIGPLEERPAESQYCVFRSGRERFCLPVLDVEEVLEWPIVTKLPLGPGYLMGIFNLRGAIVPLIDIAMTEGRRPGLLPKHVVVASMRVKDSHEDLRIGIASDEVVGTYSVTSDDMLRQAPENVPHCIGMLRHDDRLALVLDLPPAAGSFSRAVDLMFERDLRRAAGSNRPLRRKQFGGSNEIAIEFNRLDAGLRERTGALRRHRPGIPRRPRSRSDNSMLDFASLPSGASGGVIFGRAAGAGASAGFSPGGWAAPSSRRCSSSRNSPSVWPPAILARASMCSRATSSATSPKI